MTKDKRDQSTLHRRTVVGGMAAVVGGGLAWLKGRRKQEATPEPAGESATDSSDPPIWIGHL